MDKCCFINIIRLIWKWEGVGICSYLLVHFWYTRVAAVKSAMNAMFTNRIGDYFLTLGFFAIFFTFGTLDYATVFSIAPYININIITFIVVLLLLGATAKSAQIGLHGWLPFAMLRRCRYFTIALSWTIYVLINHKSTGLTRVALANEPLLQGLGVSKMYIKPNSLILFLFFYYILLRSVSSVIYSSLMKMNCYFKTGSTVRAIFWVLITLKYIWQWDKCRVFIGLVHISYPVQTKTRKIIQELVLILIFFLNCDIFNTGNPGNISENDMIKIKFIAMYMLCLNLLSFMTNEYPRLIYRGIYYWYGGKIIEKANASSNVDDNVSFIFDFHDQWSWKSKNINLNSIILLYSLSLLINISNIYNSYLRMNDERNLWDNIYVKGNKFRYKYRYVLETQRLNSILFIRSHNFNWSPISQAGSLLGKLEKIRNYSQITYREVKPSKVEKNIFWNEHKYTWKVLSENVRKKQIKLSETAVKFNNSRPSFYISHAGSSHGKSQGKLQGIDKKVVKFQEALALSLKFRLLTVYNVIKYIGSNTSGINRVVLNSKSVIVEELKNILINNKQNYYKSDSINRVKKNMYKELVGLEPGTLILSIKDRCLQELFWLILDPVIEPFSDKNSYGFRLYRSAKNAIGAIRLHINDNSYIFNGTIKGFFNKNNNAWLLKNIPLGKYHKRILNNWLKIGVISYNNVKYYKEQIIYSKDKSINNGLLNLLLINFTLNGLETIISDSIKHIIPNKFQINKIKCIRYIDDFVILADSKIILTKYIKPAIIRFLNERGLELSEEKTKIYGIRNDSLDFLGYRFKYQDNWKKLPKLSKGIALYPNKDKLLLVTKKIKNIIEKSYNNNVYNLAIKLNPTIIGWCNYFNLDESYYYRNKLKFYLYKFCWKWARKKHPKWGKKKIAKKYFLEQGTLTYLINLVNIKRGNAIKYTIPGNINAYNIKHQKLIKTRSQ